MYLLIYLWDSPHVRGWIHCTYNTISLLLEGFYDTFALLQSLTSSSIKPSYLTSIFINFDTNSFCTSHLEKWQN